MAPVWKVFEFFGNPILVLFCGGFLFGFGLSRGNVFDFVWGAFLMVFVWGDAVSSISETYRKLRAA